MIKVIYTTLKNSVDYFISNQFNSKQILIRFYLKQIQKIIRKIKMKGGLFCTFMLFFYVVKNKGGNI